MKKMSSVFGLYARSSVFKAIFIIIAMAGMQLMLLLLRFKKLSEEGKALIPEDVVYRSGVGIVLLAAFLLLTAALCLPGHVSGTGYTIARLQIGKKAVFGVQTAVNVILYLLFWAAETVFFYGMCEWFIRIAAPGAGEQAVFLAFYRSDLLHSLLPLQDIPLWIRNVLLLLGMSLAAAEFPLLFRQKKHSFTVLPAAALTIAFFVRGLTAGTLLVWTAALFCVILLKIAYDLYAEKEEGI